MILVHVGRQSLQLALSRPADFPPAEDRVTLAINTLSLAPICTTGYFACITLMSAMRPVAWQTMQVSGARSAVLRGA